MIKFQYRGLRWLPWLAYGTDVVVTVLLIQRLVLLEDVFLTYAITSTMIAWRQRRAAEHYRRALEYVVAGELTKAIRTEHLKMPSETLQEAIDDVTKAR